MKQFAWLAVLPYVVSFSSDTDRYVLPISDIFEWHCREQSKNFCYDLAEALNEAHKRRMEAGK